MAELILWVGQFYPRTQFGLCLYKLACWLPEAENDNG